MDTEGLKTEYCLHLNFGHMEHENLKMDMEIEYSRLVNPTSKVVNYWDSFLWSRRGVKNNEKS